MPPHPSLLERTAQDGGPQKSQILKGCPQPHLEGAPDGRGFGDPIRIDPSQNPQTTGNILCILIEFSDKAGTSQCRVF